MHTHTQNVKIWKIDIELVFMDCHALYFGHTGEKLLFWYRPYGWKCLFVWLHRAHSPIRIPKNIKKNMYLVCSIMEYIGGMVSGIVWLGDTKPHFDLLLFFLSCMRFFSLYFFFRLFIYSTASSWNRGCIQK